MFATSSHLAGVYHHKVMAMRLGRKPTEGEWMTDEPYGKDTVEWFEASTRSCSRAHGALAESACVVVVGGRPDRRALVPEDGPRTVVHRVDVEMQLDRRVRSMPSSRSTVSMMS